MKFSRGENTASYYVFYCSLANNVGVNIYSEFLVAKLAKDGAYSDIYPLNRFIENHKEEFGNGNLESSQDELDFVQANLADTIDFCRNIYLNTNTKKLSDELSKKLNIYKDEINEWSSRSDENVKSSLDGKELSTRQKTLLNKKISENEQIHQQALNIAQNIWSLEYKAPYIEVLGALICKVNTKDEESSIVNNNF